MEVLAYAAKAFYQDGKRPDGRNFDDFAPVDIEFHKQLTGLRSVATVRYGSSVVNANAQLKLVHLHPYAKRSFADHIKIAQTGGEPAEDLLLKVGEILEITSLLDTQKLQFERDCGVPEVEEEVQNLESSRCKWAWRVFVDFYVVKSDGCVLSATLLAINSAISHLKIPSLEIPKDFVCDHTTDFSDELEFEVKHDKKKHFLISTSSSDVVKVPLAHFRELKTNLHLNCLPFAVAFVFVSTDNDSPKPLADPSDIEDKLTNSSVTIICSPDELFSVTTSGAGLAFAKSGGAQQLLSLVKLAQDRVTLLKKQYFGKK